MSTGEILVLGGIAGATIFIGLPLGRIRSVRPAVTLFLSAMATGILLGLVLGFGTDFVLEAVAS